MGIVKVFKNHHGGVLECVIIRVLVEYLVMRFLGLVKNG